MKKIAIILMAALMILTLAAPAALMEEPTVTVSDATGSQGERVTLDVNISGNTGFSYGGSTVTYDSSALKLVDIDTSDTLMRNATTNADTGKIAFASSDNVTGDGTLYRLTFEVLDGADTSSVNVSSNMRSTDGSYLVQNSDASASVAVTKTEATPVPAQQEATPVPQQGGSTAAPTPVPQQGGSTAAPTPVPQQGGSTAAPTPVPQQQGGSTAAPTPVPQQGGSTAAPTPVPQQSTNTPTPTPAPNGADTTGSGSGGYKVPATGDNRVVTLWIVMIALGCVGICFAFRTKKDKN